MPRCIAQSDISTHMFACRPHVPIHIYTLVVRNVLSRSWARCWAERATSRPTAVPPGYTKVYPGTNARFACIYIPIHMFSHDHTHICPTASRIHIHIHPCSRANTYHGIYTHLSCAPVCCRRPIYIIYIFTGRCDVQQGGACCRCESYAPARLARPNGDDPTIVTQQ